ncbi:hypothetical protein HYW54_05275 [Candidatus Gottesmanbacteria bacterium]|nr:hypothetical protein [Candidatus Gottesmanbacteria bacterium]
MPAESLLSKVKNNLAVYYPLLTVDELQNGALLFRDELIKSLSNQPSSLPCILNPVSKNEIKPGAGIAVSIGGSYGYASKFIIDHHKNIRFLNRNSFALPIKTTAEDLFHLIARNIFTLVPNKNFNLPIGIGLAYALKPKLVDKFLDGELLYTAKGREIKGLVGKMVGQSFHKFLKENYGLDTTVVVANDAICLLVGDPDCDLVGVVGTGLNFAYWDKRQSIAPLKLGDLPGFAQKDVAINIEAKNFDKIPGTKYRDIIDKNSADRGYSLAEKEVAGAYLYQLFNAGSKNIVSSHMPILSNSDELNSILTNTFIYPKNMTPSQIGRAKDFADHIFRKSAQIVAIEICGILQKLGKTSGVIPIVMDGGLFWKAKNYPALITENCHLIFPKVTPSFNRLFGSSRRGIAILARNGII